MVRFLLVCFSLLWPAWVFAAPFSLTPLILDDKGKPRDILQKSVVLTNNTKANIVRRGKQCRYQ